jgi:hypothetical protein
MATLNRTLLIWGILLSIALAVYAAPPSSKRGKQAHEHSVATLNIVVEGSTGVVELEAPSEGIVGFEQEARSAAEKKQQDAALQKLSSSIQRMVIFDKSLNCQFKTLRNQIVKEAGEDHSEVKAEFSFSCTAPPAGTRVTFGVSSVFPELRTVNVQLLAGSQQAGATIRNNQGTLQISK